MQIQAAAPFLSSHLALAPQGLGLQGIKGSGITENTDTEFIREREQAL
jgi:hypothetical protein